MELVGDVLAHSLKESGVEAVFGIPGGENVEVLDSLRRAGISFVLVHNESSAVFMADVTARLTGKPGVCLTTLGPGATNSVAGVAHAYLDRSPVLIITAQVPESLLPIQTHQYVDLTALFTPITKSSFELHAQNARQTIRRALKLTQEGKPGPVLLQVTNQEVGKPAILGKIARAPQMQRPPRNDLAAVHEIVSNSHRPVIIVGLGLEPERPYELLRVLAESAQAPVITTPKAKGSLSDDHPLSAGTIGLTRSDPAYQVLDEADCILAVGFDVVELVKPWGQSAPLIWIAPWANRDPEIPSKADLLGPMEPVLQQLARLSWSTREGWGQVRVAALREKLERRLPVPATGRMLPQDIIQVVREATPRDTIVTTDVGSHKILTCLTWCTYTPNSFLVSNGLSCMGFSLPAAIAASRVYPHRCVVCITGDASIAMKLAELGVLAGLDAPVVIIVFNDSALDLIRSHQIRGGKLAYGVEFDNPDFVQIAEAYRIKASRVVDKEQCFKAVAEAVSSGRPALIDAMIDPISYPTSPKLEQKNV